MVYRAVILAAGIGRRLAGADSAGTGRQADMPKALLRFGGLTLLARHVALLREHGITDIAVTVGFGARHVIDALQHLGGSGLEAIENPDFREGSVVSLWAARGVLFAGAPIILMDADVLYDRRLLGRLIDSPHENCLLLDRDIEPGDEPVKLCVRGGRIVDLRKQPTELHDWHGESVGFFKLGCAAARELASRVEDYVGDGRRMMEYEEPLRDMIMASAPDRFGFEDISGLPWTEIDFPEDVVKANALLPELAA
jgi:choline kinase